MSSKINMTNYTNTRDALAQLLTVATSNRYGTLSLRGVFKKRDSSHSLLSPTSLVTKDSKVRVDLTSL
jgi:hypothetical protein